MEEGIVLAFDFGTTRIGVAVGNRLTRTARALRTVRHAGDGAAAVDPLVREWAPSALVVGLPLDADGRTQPMARRAERFARSLVRRHGIRTLLVDERHTSAVARSQVPKEQVDAKAAELILQDWLDGAPSRAPADSDAPAGAE